MKNFLKNTAAFILAIAALWAAAEVPHILHNRHCNRTSCNWFWCDYYNGK